VSFRLIHTADWQLGKAFGRFDPDVRSALSESRFDAIDAVGREAAAHHAGHVIVAGDVFDVEWPEDRTLVQALSRMGNHACRWWLMPGNHDYARNGGLWDRLRARETSNVTVLADPQPAEIEPGVWLMPAPLRHRHNLDDPTELFDAMETPDATIRVGLAHGSIRDFSSRGETPNYIAPDRAARSGLDYLALGDWHGTLQVGARTWYSGTPEIDGFHHEGPGNVLAVTVRPGSEPNVAEVATGRYRWATRDSRVPDLAAFESECARILDEGDAATTLLRLKLAGIVSLSDRIEMVTRLEDDIRHRLRHLEVDATDLVGRPTEEDLASLRIEGMLGLAAAKLAEAAEAGGTDAIVAKRALERLFVEYRRGKAI
jgi:DNA repair exonuclease SbcCD nuclease subunit